MRPGLVALTDRVGDADLVAAGRAERLAHELERVGGPGEGEVRHGRRRRRGRSHRTSRPGRRPRRRPRRSASMSAVMSKPPHSIGTDSSATGPPPGRNVAGRAGRPGRRDEAAEAVDEAVGDGQDVVAVRLGVPQVAHAAAAAPARRRRGRSPRRSPSTGRRAPSGPRRSCGCPTASSSSSRTPVLMWLVVAFHPSW